MHQRIIWLLFFSAFILDVIRLNSSKPKEKQIKEEIPKNIKQEVPLKEPEEKILKEEDKDDFEEEELKVVNNFKKKKSNKKINLRIEFCQS